MPWRDLISDCFGAADSKFGAHASDAKQAKAMVTAAKAEGATRDEVVKEIVWHCYNHVQAPDLLKPHTDEQVRQLNKFWPA